MIDDYFAITAHPLRDPAKPASVVCLEKALDAYQSEDVLGSPEKDIYDSRHFKVVGAEVDSSDKAISRGLVTVGAPLSKVLSMVALSLRAAALPLISRGLASRLTGSWTCILMYRRCLSSLFSGIYQYGVIGEKKEDELLHLPRRIAEELVLASVFAFVARTNVSVPYSKEVFATDASLKKGAVVSKVIDEEISRVIWLGGDKKGAYTKLSNPFAAALQGLGIENDLVDGEPEKQEIGAALDFSFDFCEICGGSGVVSKAAAARGLIVCPPIELSDSRHFDLGDIRLMEWLCYMLQTGKIRSLMLEPPCRTFSPAAHPAVRSYACPRGFNRRLRKTWLGNLLAFRCFILMMVARHYERPNLLEQPFLSKMAWLSIWSFLKKMGFLEASIASCAFGSPHLKRFRLLTYGLDASFLTVHCSGDHKHVRIEGKLTKPSAVYVPALADRFAEAFSAALQTQKKQHEDFGGGAAMESVVLNDLLMTGGWKVELQWHWKKMAHINILESHAYLALLKMLVLRGGDIRATTLLDSQVAKCSHAKGRSSSLALTPSLRKAAALSIAGGVYGSLGFAPTRLNVADDPTRDVSQRLFSRLSISKHLDFATLQALHALQFPRFISGWLRLVILLGCMPSTLHAFPATVEITSSISFPCWTWLALWIFLSFAIFGIWILLSRFHLCSSSPVSLSYHPQSTRSFKGKQLFHCSHCPLLFLALIPLCHAMDTGAMTGADRARAARRSGVQLFTDRVMRPQTRKRRDDLMKRFDDWTGEFCGVSILLMLQSTSVDPEAVAHLLVCYGKSLYYAGKPYGVYSETINAVVSRRGALRRQLGTAWDLAFAWVADEPASHHPAMPKTVLLALSTLAMLWAWPVEAGIFLLTWTGLMRIGETLNAYRRDLILPRDAAPGTSFVLVRITTPKTRGRTARHQSARIDQIDVVEYLSAVFGGFSKDQKLWSMSASTLRKRMNLLQAALGLPTVKSHNNLPYDLGSFRPGGATDMLQRFEDSELVRRRGRWVSTKVLEIYLQEVSTATFQTTLSDTTRSRIDRLSAIFPQVRLKTQQNLQAKIPLIAWQHLWSTPT